MKAYTFIGAIFTVIGIAVLTVGLMMMAQVYQLYSAMGLNNNSYLGNALSNALLTVFLPYMAGCIVLFAIGGIGFWAGRSKEPDVTIAVKNETAPRYTTNSTNNANEVCFVCGKEINENDIFCPNCHNRLKIKCPTCESLNKVSDTYCHYCHRSLTSEIKEPEKEVSLHSSKSVILCGSCGTSNDLDAVFCKKCGKRFS